MTEWMRLGVAAGGLLVASLCALAARTVDQDRLCANQRAHRSFVTAAALLFVCIPLLVLEVAGAVGPLGEVGLAASLAGAAVLTGTGWRSTTAASRRTPAADAIGFYPQIDPPPMIEHALFGRLATHDAASVRIPVFLVSLAGDRHLVELNQN